MRIIVTGLIAQHYTMGGVTWDYLQYLIGLKLLGHDVYYFEDSGEWPYTKDGGDTGNEWVAKDCNKNIDYLNQVLNLYGLGDRWAYLFPTTAMWFGMNDHKRKDVVNTADLLINVSGCLENPHHYAAVKKLVYIDSDPGFTQVKLKLPYGDFSKRIAAHHVHFSFGEAVSESFAGLNYDWKPTRTPIVLSEWAHSLPARNVYTTIMNWTSYKPLEFEGKCYTQKDAEFLGFVELTKKLKNICFEVALNKLQHKNWQVPIQSTKHGIDQGESRVYESPAQFLTSYGWRVVNPDEKCGDFKTYRNYILRSKGEWSVAKGGYVVSKSGWFSCRSACYLAAGRPVIVQNTGFDRFLPVGEGIVQFSNLNEAVEAVKDVEDRYSIHARRAKEIAYEYFDSNRVLRQLVDIACQH